MLGRRVGRVRARACVCTLLPAKEEFFRPWCLQWNESAAADALEPGTDRLLEKPVHAVITASPSILVGEAGWVEVEWAGFPLHARQLEGTMGERTPPWPEAGSDGRLVSITRSFSNRCR